MRRSFFAAQVATELAVANLKITCALIVLLSGMAATLVAHRAQATVQEESCIEPDIEYPVPCDDDDD